MIRSITTIAIVIFFFMAPGHLAAETVLKNHAIAMTGEPKYGTGFNAFDYTNPDAPKGGRIKLSALGTFDSLNGFISKGVEADGIALIYDTLATQSLDEPFSLYGLVAKTLEWAADRSWITFHLNPKARFHDGHPILAEDVQFTFEQLITKGDPRYKQYYSDVDKVAVLGKRRVQFIFKNADNKELPLIISQLPVLPKHYWQDKDFGATTLDPPLGSGPYRIADVKPGRAITYERVDNYWAKDLPVNRGINNFDAITYDYYRDTTVSLHALKSGEYDFRQEYSSKDWATGYSGPPFEQNMINKVLIENEVNQGMQGFIFNTRRPLFKDARVRRALAHAWDFEWSNKNLFYNQYTRSNSYFSNSELASTGLPSKDELAILNPLRKHLPAEVFTQSYRAPKTDGSGNIRSNLRQAVQLLREAGWVIKNKKLTNQATGEPFVFEIILFQPEFERIVLPFKKNLSKLGVELTIRTIDLSQYINRIRSFDFDMMVSSFPQSMSPGNEQRSYWHSSTADVAGSRNLMGIKNPAVDQLIELVIAAPTRKDLVTRVHALDRALLWGHYLIPHYHIAAYRVAYWNMFKRPATPPKYALGFNTWWIDPAQQAKVQQYRQGLNKKN